MPRKITKQIDNTSKNRYIADKLGLATGFGAAAFIAIALIIRGALKGTSESHLECISANNTCDLRFKNRFMSGVDQFLNEFAEFEKSARVSFPYSDPLAPKQQLEEDLPNDPGFDLTIKATNLLRGFRHFELTSKARSQKLSVSGQRAYDADAKGKLELTVTHPNGNSCSYKKSYR